MKSFIVHSLRSSANLLIILCFIMSSVELKLRPDVIVHWENYHIRYFDTCVKETGVDPMIPRTMLRQINLPDEESFHCYLKCIFQYNHMLTPDGKDIDYDAFGADIHVTPEVLKVCRELGGTESEICRKTYLVAKCTIDDKVNSSGR
ncbi:hypothetical protein PPYR_08572 [Photinus pyralis]|uniref:Uncharacterized protein n=1 Tax=Photinus pyralis TaxID=7054 RepID=A0A5N4AJU2_PHOPY|nr:uncharacterized protein LOC116171699 [Photinus pyralis]KAB0797579.1 hypothetical protein PPYR_08572 [Photinus pyralis]